VTRSRDERRPARSRQLVVGGTGVGPGERRRIEIAIARLPPADSVLSIPVEVLRGETDGPSVWISAGIHGDELNGVEIVRRLLRKVAVSNLRGTLFAVPVVNAFGFVHQDRYLPERRDLNRAFPGSRTGSLASRLARIFMDEIVRHCEVGVDLHTGSDHRSNWPQIRADLSDGETRRLALAFGAPIAIDATTRDGSLRDAATRQGARVLLYEAGEPQRFHPGAIRTGVAGCLRVLRTLGMLIEPAEGSTDASAATPTLVATRSAWVRARRGGLCRLRVRLGDHVERGHRLATISDIFGVRNVRVTASTAGIVIGLAQNPLVREGDAIAHLATELETSR